MSWAPAEKGQADCLLDCLRQVRLEQFAGNFATHGVTDCGKLAALQRQQFATYGITSPADIRRLTRLITVIRNLRHGAESRPAVEKSDSSRRALLVPIDWWQTSASVQRCQKKHFTDTANTSSLLSSTEKRPKTFFPHRRQSQDTQRHRRVVKRSLTTAGGQLSRHSDNNESKYDGPTSFTPCYQRTVSHLPTHVEVRCTHLFHDLLNFGAYVLPRCLEYYNRP